ncbi:MAG: thiamine/thiamine pyrophosphate ABC transporter permease ThiP [Ahrensia sp.]
MTASTRPMGTPLAGAFCALAFLVVLVFGALVPVIMFGFVGSGAQAHTVWATLTEPYIVRALRFTLWQAFWSTVLSVFVAIPVAIALHEDKTLPGRTWLLRLFALPLALPQIVAALALVALYGSNGLVSDGFEALGLSFPSIYGITGILIAHVFFNAPMCVRFLLAALDTMPPEYDRLASQLGMGVAARIRLVYWPTMRRALLSAAALVFMLCVTSFTIVLTLGGGPRATTLEVAIYQSLTFDFNVARAVTLTAMQLALTGCAVWLLSRMGATVTTGATINRRRRVAFAGGNTWTKRAASIAIVLPVAAFVLTPFGVIVVKGLAASPLSVLAKPGPFDAMLTSLSLGLAASLLTVVLVLALGTGSAGLMLKRRNMGHPSRLEAMLTEAPALVLVLPPIVLAAGWFLALRPIINPYAAGPYLVVAINAAMALPFAARLLLPAIQAHVSRTQNLTAQLGVSGWAKLRLIDWPVLRRPALLAGGFAMALSLGDVGVIALFGSRDLQTLPWLILQNMGSYRSEDGAALALVLCLMTSTLMLIADRELTAGRDHNDD